MKPLRTLSLLLMTAATLAFAGCSKEDPQGQPSWGGGGGGTDTPKQPGPCSNMIVAHRGGSTEAGTTAAPDNSISSLQYAMTLGCYASECDIYWTADNDVIVAHADSQCKINGLHPWEATVEEIRAAGSLPNGERIPTLAEYIDAVMAPGSCTKLWLDIKNITSPSSLPQYPIEACRRACEIIKEKGAQNFVEFICTGNSTVMESSFGLATAENIPIGWMSNSSAQTYNSKGYTWANLSIEYISKSGNESGKRTIDEFYNLGIQLSVFNVDTDADIQYYTSQKGKLKAICTNYPRKLINAMK